MTTAEKSSHTPGPWEPWTDDDGKSYSVVSLSMTTKKTVCYIYGNRAQSAKKIDARLIAAAPDLLAAAKALIDCPVKMPYDEEALLWDSLRAAVARAEARS